MKYVTEDGCTDARTLMRAERDEARAQGEQE